MLNPRRETDQTALELEPVIGTPDKFIKPHNTNSYHIQGANRSNALRLLSLSAAVADPAEPSGRLRQKRAGARNHGAGRNRQINLSRPAPSVDTLPLPDIGLVLRSVVRTQSSVPDEAVIPQRSRRRWE